MSESAELMDEAFYGQIVIDSGRRAIRRQLAEGELKAAELNAKVVAGMAGTSVESELESARNHVRADDDGPVYE